MAASVHVSNGRLFVDDEILDLAALVPIQAAVVAASEAHALNATFSDTEVEAALNALGAKVNELITALENAGILIGN